MTKPKWQKARLLEDSPKYDVLARGLELWVELGEPSFYDKEGLRWPRRIVQTNVLDSGKEIPQLHCPIVMLELLPEFADQVPPLIVEARHD